MILWPGHEIQDVGGSDSFILSYGKGVTGASVGMAGEGLPAFRTLGRKALLRSFTCHKIYPLKATLDF